MKKPTLTLKKMNGIFSRIKDTEQPSSFLVGPKVMNKLFIAQLKHIRREISQIIKKLDSPTPQKESEDK